ncbi:MAG TPA: 30S ribosomal protein S14 [Thermoanaerobaculia bacterium]|nr:30S ribosomal protein S14 [Thermoanaerobaculia bacterium]
MATTAKVAHNEHRKKLVKKHAAKRAELKAVILNAAIPPEEREAAARRLRKMPRNSSAVRVRNRCELTGRPRGYFRKFGLSRLALRDLALQGYLPGVIKASW